MNKQALMGARQYFDMVHDVTRRAIGTFSDDDLDFRPAPGTRSPRELIYHIYAMEKTLSEGVKAGKMTEELEKLANPESDSGKAAMANLKTVSQLQQFADESHAEANRAAQELTDQDVSKNVEASYGTFPAWQFFNFIYDEHWHHRGQLYTYLRLLGKEPPMLYSYEG